MGWLEYAMETEYERAAATGPKSDAAVITTGAMAMQTIAPIPNVRPEIIQTIRQKWNIILAEWIAKSWRNDVGRWIALNCADNMLRIHRGGHVWNRRYSDYGMRAEAEREKSKKPFIVVNVSSISNIVQLV